MNGHKMPSFEDMIYFTYKGIVGDERLSDGEKMWFKAILSILAKKGYVRVLAKDCLIDIQALRDTDRYASFYDVYNKKNYFVTSVMPVRIAKLENPYKLLYGVYCGDIKVL